MVVAVIDIRVKGEANLKKAKRQVNQIKELIKGIEPVPSIIDSRAFTSGYKRVQNQANKFKAELKDLIDVNKKIIGTTASLNSQLGNLQAIFGNLTADTTEWRHALVATERAQESLFRTNQRVMVQRAKSLSSQGGAKQIVGSLIGFEGEVTKLGEGRTEPKLAQSIDGLSAYRAELQRLRNAVKLGSKEYNDLGAAIEKVNRTLSAKEGLAGLRQNLDQVSNAQSRLLASNEGYLVQATAMRAAESALNEELFARQKILDQITRSEQAAMGGSVGVVAKAGKGGIAGLKTALAEAEGIQSRMITTEENYVQQVEIVKGLQQAINQAIAERDLLMGKVNIKEEKSISLAQRLRGLAGNVGSAAVKGARPGRAIERRGLIAGGVGGLAGLGMASNTGVGQGLTWLGSQTMGAAGNIAGVGANIGIPGMGIAAKGITDTKVALAGLMATAKAVAGINVLNPAFIATLGVAWMALGNKGFIKAAKDLGIVGKAAKKTTAGLFNTAKSVKLFLGLGREANGMSHSFKISAAAAKELGNTVEDVARKIDIATRKQRLARAQFEKGVSLDAGNIQGQRGFGAWSTKMDKEYPRGDARIQMEELNRARSINLELTNAEKRENIRLVEIKGKQLDIEQRIERTLKKKGVQVQKNGKYLEKRQNKGMGGMMSGFSGTKVGQAVLGGGFPMLFGGGPGAVGGGVIGGLMGGFAGGIGGSIIGGMVDRAVASIGQLGMAMNPLTADIGKLTTALGLAGTEAGARIALIEKLAGKEAALTAVRRRMVDQIGNANTQALEDFGETWQNIINNMQVELLKISALVADFANKTLEKIEERLILRRAQKLDPEAFNRARGMARKEAIGFRINEVQNDPNIPAINKKLWSMTPSARFFSEGSKEVYDKSLLQSAKGILGISGGSGDKVDDAKGKFEEINEIITGSLKPLEEQRQILEDTLKGGTAYAEVEKRIRQLKKEIAATSKDIKAENVEITKEQRKQIEDAVKGEEHLRMQLEMWTKIKDVVASGITNAITGLIKGTQTLGEALSGIIGQIGQIIMQTAISRWVGGWSIFNPVKTSAEGGYNTAGGFKAFAQGGVTTGPTLGLIGEAGEPEYVIPASKMEGAMGRYSAGARGQGVIPGGGTVASGSGVAGGSVQIDYTGPILSFNSEDYVPRSAIPEIVNGAARRGAAAGSAQVFSQLKNSRSQRSRIGL